MLEQRILVLLKEITQYFQFDRSDQNLSILQARAVKIRRQIIHQNEIMLRVYNIDRNFNNQVQYFMGVEKSDLFTLLELGHTDKLQMDNDGFFLNKDGKALMPFSFIAEKKYCTCYEKDSHADSYMRVNSYMRENHV